MTCAGGSQVCPRVHPLDRLIGDQLPHIEGQRVGDENERDDREQDRQRSGQGVDEEFQRCLLRFAVTPAPDQEEHADEAEVEENVEDQQVEDEEEAE